MSEITFSQLEHEGWQRNAADYDKIDLPSTRQAFDPILDELGDLDGRHLLELASGTGHLAAEAVARGGTVVGVDAAPRMVEIARETAPGATFLEADAEALPCDDGQFDVVICCFGLLHFDQPSRAFREAIRVLKPGGTLVFTLWSAPEHGGEFFGLILEIYQRYANLELGLPPAPPMFALTDPEKRDPLLMEAGFREIRTRELGIVWPISEPNKILEFILKGAVRMRMVFERQTPQVQDQIRKALIEAAEVYLVRGGIPSPALLVTATKG